MYLRSRLLAALKDDCPKGDRRPGRNYEWGTEQAVCGEWCRAGAMGNETLKQSVCSCDESLADGLRIGRQHMEGTWMAHAGLLHVPRAPEVRTTSEGRLATA